VTYSEARTATELRILKQRTFSANLDVQKALQDTLEHVFKIIDKYCDLYNIASAGDYEIAYKWDDSIIVDKDAERQVDLIDVEKGLMSRVEYRMKWFGETEAQAKASLKLIDDEKLQSMTMQQQVMQTNSGETQQSSASDTKLERANKSGETTKMTENDDDARKDN
jgi:hypothetical protein